MDAQPVAGVGRRFVCKCGCGRWWVWPRGMNGRPVEFATDDCRALWRSAQKRIHDRAYKARHRGTP